MHPGDLPDSLWNTGLGVSAEHQEPCVETGRWHSPAHSLFRWKLHRCSGTRLGAQGCEGGQRAGGAVVASAAFGDPLPVLEGWPH